MENNELPSINVNIPGEDTKPFIADEKILDYYEEAIQNLREDRLEADEMFRNFAEMVVNGGDSSSASKEALVNFLRIKTETNDRMIKILDLWTRTKMKEKDTFPRYLAVQQNNKIEQPRNARKMIEMFNKIDTENANGSES